MEVNRATIGLTFKSPELGFLDQARNFSDELFGPNLLRSNDSRHESLLTPAQFGCLTGLIIIVFSKYQVDKEKSLSRLWFLLKSPKIKEYVFTAICFSVFLVFVPILLFIITTFFALKKLDERKLRRDEASSFKGFLNGEDIVWACEDVVSKSIVNILAFVRAPTSNYEENFSELLLHSIRDRIYKKLIVPNQFPKMFYRRRKSDSGYFYWTDENNLSVNDYARLSDTKNADLVQSEEEFKTAMSGISNNPLPAEDTALWECLVGQRAVKVGDDLKYPVSFMCSLKALKVS